MSRAHLASLSLFKWRRRVSHRCVSGCYYATLYGPDGLTPSITSGPHRQSADAIIDLDERVTATFGGDK